jgi:hypothetical protein
MRIDLQRGRFLRVVDGAGSTGSEPHNSPTEGNRIMKRLILALSLAAVALSGCAQLKELYSKGNADAGSTGVAQQSPYPSSSENIAGN